MLAISGLFEKFLRNPEDFNAVRKYCRRDLAVSMKG